MNESEAAVVVEGVSRRFGSVIALDAVDLRIEAGTVLGLLGHNGAGKTTLVRILATLLPPTAGRARIAGFDVVSQPREVRRRIGLTGQYAAVDELLTGRENLQMVGRLLGENASWSRRRADDLLERFALADAADRVAGTYSGGMRRRLDVAVSLVGHPVVLFLDEPTTGLDPVGRNDMWALVEELVHEGTTLLLTTQYLDEADRLADRIVLLARGAKVAEGTAAELKRQVGGSSVRITVREAADLEPARLALTPLSGTLDVDLESRTIAVPVSGAEATAPIVRALDDGGVVITGLEMISPSLDDVYLAHTGHDPAQEGTPDEHDIAPPDGPPGRRPRRPGRAGAGIGGRGPR